MLAKTIEAITSMRLDKWLWCARFFKTRQLAAEAIRAGKIKVDGIRVKPARSVRTGDVYTITHSPFAYTITVKSLADRRGPASEAAKLYEENPQSIAARTLLQEQLKLHNNLTPRSQGRPTKRERRKLVKFTRN